MRREFDVHKLNAEGMIKAKLIAESFSDLLSNIEDICGLAPDARTEGARELAIVRTKLEEACFFAKRAMAVQSKNQEPKA